MTKTEQLNKLFQQWKKEIPGNKGCFISDGIINEHEYNNAKTKILFLTKEPNSPNKEEWDFRQVWNEQVRYIFASRISEWTYGLLDGFKPYSTIKYEEKLAAIKKIALMNIKKVGGGGSSNEIEILAHLKTNMALLNRQIEIINPELIILGVSWDSIKSNLIKNTKWEDSGYNVDLCNWNGKKVIDFYHPSSRIVPAASYSLLQNIINTEVFKNL